MSSTAIDKVETAAEKVVDRVAEGKVDSTDSNVRCKAAALRLQETFVSADLS